MIQANSNHFSYRTAIYCRLSKDDEQKGESASIQNQRDMLEHYVKAKGWNIVDVYVDDGYTGLKMVFDTSQSMTEWIPYKIIMR